MALTCAQVRVKGSVLSINVRLIATNTRAARSGGIDRDNVAPTRFGDEERRTLSALREGVRLRS